MANENPYASPRPDYAHPEAMPPVLTETVTGAWRDKGMLVMIPGAILPQCCVFSGQYAEECHEYWLGQGNFSYATIKLPISNEISAMNLLHGWITAILAMVGAAIPFVALIALPGLPLPQLGIAAGVGLAVLIVGILWGILLIKVLSLKMTTTTHLWLTGAHPQFLQNLPEWASVAGSTQKFLAWMETNDSRPDGSPSTRGNS